MSTVKRLAEEWADVVQYGNDFMGGPSGEEERELTERDARWWLRAIAEKLDAEWPGKYGRRTTVDEATRWLCEQAKEGE